MPQHWIIAPSDADPSGKFEEVWQFDLRESVISIGFAPFGNISKMTKDEVARIAATEYSHKPHTTRSFFTNMLWAFYHEITLGDIILARRGRKTLAGVGTVTGSAYYEPGKNSATDHSNFLPISWHEKPRDLIFPSVVFPMHTVARSSQEQFDKLLGGAVVDPPTEIPETISDPNVFVLEKYLEEFIVGNFVTIFGRDLAIYTDTDGNTGQQYSTDIGPIDILAKNLRDNSFVVIELKKGRPSDQVVGQVLRYMGWVSQHLCQNGESVRGMVICKEPDAKLSYAIRMISNVDVRYYEVDFRLR